MICKLEESILTIKYNLKKKKKKAFRRVSACPYLHNALIFYVFVYTLRLVKKKKSPSMALIINFKAHCTFNPS